MAVEVRQCMHSSTLQGEPCPAGVALLSGPPGRSVHTPHLSSKTNAFGAESTGHCQSKDGWLSRMDGHHLGICFRGWGRGFFISEEEIYIF